MPSITEWNFTQVFSPFERERFWALAKLSMTSVYGDERSLDQLRQAIDASPTSEQMAFYHQDPLNFAARLLNPEITNERMEKYKEISQKLTFQWTP